MGLMMKSKTYSDRIFERMALHIAYDLLAAPAVNTKSWQSQDVSDRPEMVSYELMHARVEYPIPPEPAILAEATKCNLPWAEDHFRERVGGQPLNPPPSEQWWPYAVQGNAAHKADEQFSHTYPERFWPMYANIGGRCADSQRQICVPHVGIRYRYGDLHDLLELIDRDPYTRQAYLPVWFPEDTGAASGQRVPCTLGYHFLHREGQLHMEYHIRSCDYMRHWRDDVYMAGRLCQWICDQAQVKMEPGTLTMNIGSFHIFDGDRVPLHRWYQETSEMLNIHYYDSIARAL